MKKSLASITCILVCALLVSCQKDNAESPTAVALAGSYKFVSLEMNGVSTSTGTNGSEVETSITVTKYRSKNNADVVNFTTSTLSGINLSYDIDTTLEVSYYMNGNLEDSIEMPFQVQVPSSNSTSPYKVVTSDSLYFSAGSMFMDSSSSHATRPGGARIKKEGDLLLLIIPANRSTTDDNNGAPVTTTFTGVGTVTLQKL